MNRWFAISVVALAISGCGDDDGHDVGKKKIPLPLDQVPAIVMKAAKEFAPDLTFYAAYRDTFDGQESIELKGKTKTGKIKEVEISPEGKVLGTE